MIETIRIFLVFLRLGCISFGGPIAHLGHFRAEFVDRRKWIGAGAYGDIVALAQFVPGPASSQTGFALGLLRGGLSGGIAAWAGFTLPSAGLMLLAAYSLSHLAGSSAASLLHGLKIVAVAAVAQAVWSLGRSFCPDWKTRVLASFGAAFLIAAPGGFLQLGCIGLGAAFGVAFLPAKASGQGFQQFSVSGSHRSATASLALFLFLLTFLPHAAATRDGTVTLLDAFYQSGALVFGGGHVVLPLLEARFVKPGWIGGEDFLAGYGVAQALPGPLFTFAAFLGAKTNVGPGGVAGAVAATAAIFLPGMLLFYGALPFWNRLRGNRFARAAMNGVNAAVAGILGAALYQISTAAIVSPADAAIAILAFAALNTAAFAVFPVVIVTALAGAIAVSI